jgi:hypothetical protein
LIIFNVCVYVCDSKQIWEKIGISVAGHLMVPVKVISKECPMATIRWMSKMMNTSLSNSVDNSVW